MSQFHSASIILPPSHLELRRKLELEFARHNLEMNVVAEVEELIIKKNMGDEGLFVLAYFRQRGGAPLVGSFCQVKNRRLGILGAPLYVHRGL